MEVGYSTPFAADALVTHGGRYKHLDPSKSQKGPVTQILMFSFSFVLV